jgi:hypothetical protein
MSNDEDFYEDDFEDPDFDEESLNESEVFDDGLDELSREFVESLVDKIMVFMKALVGHDLRNYQKPLARRIIQSVLLNDGQEITALAARQSGKSETIANVVAALMVLLPRLARMYPDLLGDYKNGFRVGLFAPVEGQAETLFSRVISRLTSDQALAVLGDPEIDDEAKKISGVTKQVKLINSGSSVMMMTANPRAKIESKTFDFIVIDECQEADDFIVAKSISPMLASTDGTMVKTGTPTTHKNNFYRSIQLNKRMQTAKGAKQSHFQWDWRDVAKEQDKYAKFIKKEMLRIGEHSDEFQMSYNCKWLLERGMFVTSSVLDELGDTSQEVVGAWHRTPVIVGIDPARKVDSTVVTVVWVDWERPDEFGLYDHRVLNWLEIQGDDWEDQYFQIVNFLENYNVLSVGVDANGVGDAVAQRLRLLLPRAEVFSVGSSQKEQSERWKHLKQLIDRRLIGWPAHAKTRRLIRWKRFYQQMSDLEVKFQGPNFLAHAPEEAHAHDDFADSLAIACALTLDMTMPTIEVVSSPFYR